MANPENIINSIRNRCTIVFETLQENLDAVDQDRDDFVDELGAAFFTDWFSNQSGYDITFNQMVDAVQAMQTLNTAFESVRSRLQVVRTR